MVSLPPVPSLLAHSLYSLSHGESQIASLPSPTACRVSYPTCHCLSSPVSRPSPCFLPVSTLAVRYGGEGKGLYS